jgi:hypothetical protein
MSNEITAEIFATGKWNGMQFAASDLSEIVGAFKKLGDNHRVPLKLGHNDTQPKTDGEPALGWVADVWVEGSKLMAKFVDVPTVMMEAIKKKLYRNVSVELDMGVQYKSDFFKYVLSGVAILGADIPAVNVLADLTTYMSKQAQGAYTRTSVLSFTTFSGDNQMSDELKLAQEKAAKLEAELSAMRAEQETAKFSADKTAFQSKLDGLVKDGVIVPAQREKFMAGITKENIKSLEFSVDAIAAGAPAKPAKSGEAAKTGTAKSDDFSGQTPDAIVFAKAKKLQMENKITFSQAQSMVLSSDPDLAREYVQMNNV